MDVCVVRLSLAGVDALALLFLLNSRRCSLVRETWWEPASKNAKLQGLPAADALKEFGGSKDPESWIAFSESTLGTLVG